MKPTECEAEIASWAIHAAAIKSIRTRVFIEEQGVPPELEWDGHDEQCAHFIIRHKSCIIATARLKPDGQIGRMAVLKPFRRKGTGHLLLATVLSHARASGFTRVFLHAQVAVIDFYRKQGFACEGEIFMDAGIPHQEMYKKLC